LIYRIEIQNRDGTEILHEPDMTGSRHVAACEFTEDLNAVPSATITVTPENPAFDKLHELTTLVRIINTKTNETEFDGRILQISDLSMNASGMVSKKIICEGAMGYLCDTVQLYHHYENTDVREFLSALLDYHNSVMSWHNPERVILMGVCTVHNFNSKTTAQRSTMDEIRENLISRLGGVMRVRRNEENQLVLDYYVENDFGQICNTKVELARNMKSLSSGTDTTGLITRLYPFGCQMNDETGERLTIAEVNYGMPYLDDEDGIAQYGVKCGFYTWDDVTLPENLLERGREYLKQVNQIKKSYKATVLDLSLIGKDADTFRAGNTYRFVNPLIGLDDNLKIIKRTVNIFKPYQPVVEIGDKLERITSIAAQTRNYIEYEAPKQKSEILQQAKDNATALITSATHGYVIVEPDEILVMNTDDKETATKVWRFNVKGLGYSNTGYNGEFGLAMTMDGAIVADYITTGVMSANLIRGGSLIVGGGDGRNGLIQVLNDSGAEICRLDKNGADIHGNITSQGDSGFWITIDNGQITGGNSGGTYMAIDATTTIEDTSGTVHRGVRIRADAVSLEHCSHFGISDARGNGYEGQSGSVNIVNAYAAMDTQIVLDVWIDENGDLQKYTMPLREILSASQSTYYFQNGLMITELD